MIRISLMSDSGVSLLLHGLKLGLALVVNWLVLSRFPPEDYVTWAVTSSVLVVATASDLGIGQATTTQLLHSSREQWPAVLKMASHSLLPLAMIGAVFVFLALGAQPADYKAAMATAIGLRILTIPAGALLNAVNQFKLRKAIEVTVYLVAAVAIAAIALASAPVLWALLVLNTAFLAGAVTSVLVARRYVVTPLDPPAPAPMALSAFYRTSVPYMVNNLTGLLTYGGLIWLCSYLINTDALARLSVLHTFVLINVYQVYDVLLKSRQADMVRPAHVARMARVNLGFMLLIPSLALLVGPSVLGWFAPQLVFQPLELLLFAAFLSLELGFLFLQSVMQVDPAKAGLLSKCALVKFALQALALSACGLALRQDASLHVLLLFLTVATLFAYAICLLQLRSAEVLHLPVRVTCLVKRIFKNLFN